MLGSIVDETDPRMTLAALGFDIVEHGVQVQESAPSSDPLRLRVSRTDLQLN